MDDASYPDGPFIDGLLEISPGERARCASGITGGEVSRLIDPEQPY
jgi:hypothetical protein